MTSVPMSSIVCMTASWEILYGFTKHSSRRLVDRWRRSPCVRKVNRDRATIDGVLLLFLASKRLLFGLRLHLRHVRRLTRSVGAIPIDSRPLSRRHRRRTRCFRAGYGLSRLELLHRSS